MAFLALVRQEFMALPRSRFGLLGCGALLAFIALLAATVGTLPRREWGFLLPAFGVAPTVLIPVAAAGVSQARSSGFHDALFTSPVRMTEYAAARITVMILLGLTYLALLSPFVAIEAWHVGVSAGTIRHILLGLGMVVYCSVLGTLIGVLFTSRGTIAAVVCAVAAMIGLMVSITGFDSIAGLEPSASRNVLLRILHLSGGVLLVDALVVSDLVQAANRVLPALTFLLVCTALAAFCCWAFGRAQSALGWEVRARTGALLGFLLLGIFLTPAATTSLEYEPITPPAERTGWSMSAMMVRVVEPGHEPPPRQLFRPDTIGAGERNEVDLVLKLWPSHDPTGAGVHNLTLRLSGQNLTVEPTLVVVAQPERDAPSEDGTFVVRVPAILEAPPARHLRENPHTLIANATYWNDTLVQRWGHAEIKVHSEVRDVETQMALGGSVAPSLAVFAFLLRRYRLR